MRLRLALSTLGTNRILPINYQYEFSAWIYHTLNHGNPEFASWLHNHGYTRGKRSFKLFTFSNLETERYKIIRDRFKILSNEASLVLTFRMEEAVQHFITGLFRKQKVSIGDSKSRVDFEVRGVEALPKPVLEEEMMFRALSPVCVTRPEERNGKLTAQYLKPAEPEYEKRFFENLVTRYKAVHPEVNGQFDDVSRFRLRPIGKPKSRLVKIKADTPQETRIRGYLYDFKCTASVELLRFGYEAGFAEKNSLGFGCVGIKK